MINFLGLFTLLSLLVIGVTSPLKADNINSVDGPECVVTGTLVPISVRYTASTDRDIMINFMMNAAPWTVYGHKRVSVPAGSATIVIHLAVNITTPVAGSAYKYGVSLLPSGANWSDRIYQINQVGVSSREAPQMFTVYPAEYSGALRNPLKGFRPDTYRNNYDDEYATITRCYLKWNELENDVNDTVQKIKDVCDQKWKDVEQYGVKVIPRVYLDWNEEPGNEYWPADMTTGDYSSEQFKQRLVRLISRLGECWDDDPRVAWVQMGFIGRWGEHHHPEPTAEIQELMGDAFAQAFQNKKFLVRHANEFTNYDVGVHWDSWAHTQQVDKAQHGAGIEALNESTNRWMTYPIEGETAYNWGQSDVQPGDGPDDTLTDPVHRDFLIDTIRNLHCSGLGWIARYDQDDPIVRVGAEEVQKAFGYRFVIPHFCWGQRAEPNGSLQLLFSVINTGSAPFYEDWPVEFSLLDPQTGDLVWKTVLDTVDIRQWVPGDDWDEENDAYLIAPLAHEVDVSITLPGFSRLPVGEYIAALAILEPLGETPSVRFAVNNYLNGGRHPLGRVGIGLDIAGNHTLDNVFFDDPMQDDRLSYLLQTPASPAPSIIKSISISDGMCHVQAQDFASGTLRVMQRSNDLVQWEAVDVSYGTGTDFEWVEPTVGESHLFFRLLTE